MCRPTTSLHDTHEHNKDWFGPRWPKSNALHPKLSLCLGMGFHGMSSTHARQIATTIYNTNSLAYCKTPWLTPYIMLASQPTAQFSYPLIVSRSPR